MGEILRQTERAKGQLKIGPQLPRVTTGIPTLTDLGLTKRESAEAQMLSERESQELFFYYSFVVILDQAA
jgi:hypothetical protein